MFNILRRNKSTAVQVRRAGEPEQDVIDVPRARQGVGPAPGVSGPQPNVTQNVIYISTPATTPPPPAPANPEPAPREIHHHTTVHHVSRVIAPGRGLSFFGVAGLVLGGLACGAAYVPGAENFVRPLALAGGVASGLGLLSAIVIGRSGRGMPVLGLIVSSIGYGMWFQHNGGQLQAEMRKMQQALPIQLPKVDLGLTEPKAALVIEPPKIVSPPLEPVVKTAPPKGAFDLESVREAAALRMGLDYKSAKAKADETHAEVIRLRATAEPGSPELSAASQRATEAVATLNGIEQQLRDDPAVVAAERTALKKK